MPKYLLLVVVVTLVSAGVYIGHRYVDASGKTYDHEALFDSLTWSALIERDGAEKAREEYLRVTKTVTPVSQHSAAHAFGRALYEQFGVEGLRYCDVEYRGGCIHEMIARDFLDEEDPLSSASQCVEYEISVACEHALGHGFAAFFGYDEEGLRKGLARCTEIGAAEMIHGCAFGVFMEYYFKDLQGPSVQDPDSTNAYELCGSFEGISRSACFYNISTLWFLSKEGSADGEAWPFEIAQRCRDLPDMGTDRVDCAAGVGRSIASLGTIENAKRIALCPEVFRGEPEHIRACVDFLSLFRSLWEN